MLTELEIKLAKTKQNGFNRARTLIQMLKVLPGSYRRSREVDGYSEGRGCVSGANASAPDTEMPSGPCRQK